jgi:hypothetical protein
MKKLLLIFTLATALLATACQQKPASTSIETASEPATTALADGSYCYEYRVGQDVTTVNLVVTGNNVTGEMNWLPYEKDSGRGTLQGTRTGNEISAIWTYVIEGSNQTEEVMFKVEGEQLLRKTGELVDANNDGNLKMKDPASAAYTETYAKVTCQ